MSFMRIWLVGIVRPREAMDSLAQQQTPIPGLAAVLIRFVGTSIIVTLPLYLLGRVPFQPSYLRFLETESYYGVLVFVFPIFGLVAWLLMSSTAYLILRLAGRVGDFDRILNLVGMSMLIPMPVVWLWDVAMIALGSYQLATMAPSHALFQVWEAALGFMGLRRILGLGPGLAAGLAIVINIVFVLLGALVSR